MADRVIDVVFGKRVGTSMYHVNTLYSSRDLIPEDPNRINQFIVQTVSKIVDLNLPDNVAMILNKLNANVTSGNIEKVNEAFAELSFLQYELWFIFRNDIHKTGDFQSINRIYAMNKAKLNPGISNINNVEIGITNIFDSSLDMNLNTMVMSFLQDGKIKLDDPDLLDITGLIEEYRILANSKETIMMNTDDIRNMLEQLGFKFIIALNHYVGD
jgi:hypothetical protein